MLLQPLCSTLLFYLFHDLNNLYSTAVCQQQSHFSQISPFDLWCVNSFPRLLPTWVWPARQAMDKSVEVRTADPCELVQRLPVPAVRAMCHHGGWLFAATRPATHHSSLLKSPRSGGDDRGVGGNEVWLFLAANRTPLVERLIRARVSDGAARGKGTPSSSRTSNSVQT